MTIKINKENEKGRNKVLIVGTGVFIALAVSVLLLIIYGILLTVTGLSESTMSTAITIIIVLSIAIASIYVAMRVESMGWLNGAITGLVYMVVLVLLGLLCNIGISFGTGLFVRVLTGFVVGALSGVIGINLK